MKKVILLGTGVVVLLGLGCAKHTSLVAVPTPAPVAVAEPTPVPPLPTPVPTPPQAYRGNSYVVKPGDSLWKIAGKDEVMGDSFEWPLLFKANRDQIVDPNEIDLDQDLTWLHSYYQEDVDDAVRAAKATPVYRRRKSLPQP